MQLVNLALSMICISVLLPMAESQLGGSLEAKNKIQICHELQDEIVPLMDKLKNEKCPKLREQWKGKQQCRLYL